LITSLRVKNLILSVPKNRRNVFITRISNLYGGKKMPRNPINKFFLSLHLKNKTKNRKNVIN